MRTVLLSPEQASVDRTRGFLGIFVPLKPTKKQQTRLVASPDKAPWAKEIKGNVHRVCVQND
jgi:hypothetical protein